MTNWARTKCAPIDWDGDGDKDLITTDHAHNSWPRYYENVGSVSNPVFVRGNDPTVKGNHLLIEASHEMGACPVDWDNDGREDILLGGENGCVYYYNRKLFDPQPNIVSATIQNLNTGDKITSTLDDYFDLDTNASQGQTFGETSLPVYDISYSPGNITLKCRHLTGRTYNIYYADGIPSGTPNWQLGVGDLPASGTGYLEWTDSGDTGTGRPAPDDQSVKQRYYLIKETE